MLWKSDRRCGDATIFMLTREEKKKILWDDNYYYRQWLSVEIGVGRHIHCCAFNTLLNVSQLKLCYLYEVKGFCKRSEQHTSASKLLLAWLPHNSLDLQARMQGWVFFFNHRLNVLSRPEISICNHALIWDQGTFKTASWMNIHGVLFEHNCFAIGCWWFNSITEIIQWSVIDERLLFLVADLPRLILLEIFLIPAQACRKCATHASMKFAYIIYFM